MSRPPHSHAGPSSQPYPTTPSSSRSIDASSPPSSRSTYALSRAIYPSVSAKRKTPAYIEIPDDDDDDDDAPTSSISIPKRNKRPSNPGASAQLNYDSDDDAGAHDVIDLSQDTEGEFGEDWEHYGHMLTKIVGVQYYNGIATVGEQVLLMREPRNKYDSNAIRVDNVGHKQIGHIPATLARLLAPLLDSGSLHAEGIVAGIAGSYDMPLTLNLYGSAQPAVRVQIKAQIKAAKLPLRASEEQKRREALEKTTAKAIAKAAVKRAKSNRGRGRGLPTGYEDVEIEGGGHGDFVGSLAPGIRMPEELPIPSWEHLVGASQSFNPREIGEVVQKFGMGEEDLAAYPSAAQPDRLATKMLPYQLQGLAWLLQKEHPAMPTGDDLVQLWKKVPGGWQNIGTNFTSRVMPELASGGVLADDMGLGKTLQMIALMVTDPHREAILVPKPRDLGNCNGGTLIVCPVSVMSNWTGQIKHHVSESMPLKVAAYHGSGRGKVEFGEYDVIVTSYGTLSSEFKAKGSGTTTKGLHSMKWRRVILDEAHQIRNPKAKSSIAATNLNAESRWCLTGTPIINTLKDLYSLLRFLRFSGGLSEFDIFNRVLIRPLNHGLPEASPRLQALMASLCLRRTKSMKFIDLRLPECKEFVHKIQWYPEEEEKYKILDAEAKGLLDRFANRGAEGADKKDQYRFLLEILLRMRQVCNHWTLCGERIESLMKLAGMSKVTLTMENRRALQDLLQIAIDSQEECAVCLEGLHNHNPRITICKHVFGLECIEKVIEMQQKCPLCRCELTSVASSLVEPMTIEDTEQTPPPVDLQKSGSKIEALLKILKATREKDTTNKTIVFSQWTSFLDIIEPHLRAAGIAFTRIDGSMNVQRRDRALHALESDPECTVMLASLAVASVGLNLVAANQVILTDSWWAPAIEDQAVDRVHRLGQRRETTVFRLVMEGSIEERVLGIQEKKRGLVATAFQERGEGRGRRAKEAKLADLQMLLGGVAAGAGAGAGAGAVVAVEGQR